MKEFIKKFDFLGNKYSFEENSHSNYTSTVGSIFSIIIIITSMVLAFLFGQEVYKRNNPSVYSLQEFIPYSRVNFTDFPILFSFFWENGTSIKDPNKYFDLSMKMFMFSK